MMLAAAALLLSAATAVAQNCPTSAPNSFGSDDEVISELQLGYYEDENRYWSPDQAFYGGAGTEVLGCTSPSDNTRGYYNAHIVPCTFSFHSATATDEDLGFQQTTVCSDDNMIGNDSVMDYVKHWKDECVGDFARCYSVDQDEDIFLDFVCKKDWKFPQGTTHISVSCEGDKEAKKLATDHYHGGFGGGSIEDEEKREDARLDKEIRHQEVAVLFVLSFFSAMILCCCFAAYRLFALPYKQFLETRLNNQEGETLVGSSGGSGTTNAEVV